ncbi:MAG: type II toxin-antitoxin system HicA family toxin, partial [Ruminococcus sp.]|nr:type II toxin-antitoxin system HicA family toxin [Ruminococcus sp.]
MNYGELKKLIKKNGCKFYKEGKRHEKWINPKTGEIFPVERHNQEEVAEGTLQSIQKA